jgi:hypothetical protein
MKTNFPERGIDQTILPDLTQKCDLHPSRTQTDGWKESGRADP